MAKKKNSAAPTRARRARRVAGTAVQGEPMRRICAMRENPPRSFGADVSGTRVQLILAHGRKWVNGTVLRYGFFDASFPAWTGNEALRKQVRTAFKRWSDVGIGLRFEETAALADATLRIGFQPDDGHWSYVGRDVEGQGLDERTMNLDPLDAIANGEYGIDVACHEIGHSLGLQHEHQNPFAGIVWDEEAVYAALAAPPNRWSRQQTFHNILNKIPADQVQGSSWDPDSVMHYPFEAGLILEPAQYRTAPLQPAGGLSLRDREWVRTFYPPLVARDHEELARFQSARLSLGAGEQRNFLLKPTSTQKYSIQTFGLSDTVAVLFERDAAGNEIYLEADDDSGYATNAHIRRTLHEGRTYVLRLRLYWAAEVGATAVMWW